jgi:hypothetical protein
MTTTVPAAQRGVTQRIRHLGLLWVVCLVVLAVAGLAAGWAGGPQAALGLSAGVLLVAASYTVTTVAIAWADRMDPRLVLPVGMGLYVTKFSLLALVLMYVGSTEWAGKIPMTAGICAGVVAWTAAQIWWIVHHEHPYR